jgi:predicted nucleic acid-binding protein
MKGMVIDASVAASWFLADEISEYASGVLGEMQKGGPVFAPSLWPLEMASVLFNAERRNRIDKKHRDAALESVARLSITICTGPTLADLKILQGYAEKYQLTAYDAEYLRVAKELKLPLATQDSNLAAAASREKIAVFNCP